jgi:predicted acylesterase/phospholipase RssA
VLKRRPHTPGNRRRSATACFVDRRGKPGAFAVTVTLLLALAGPLRCQEALVLSGGGARGLAHAGVIMGLEELGYDPDMVIGTSMGAVVGALYAAGYTPEEIGERITEIDWAAVFLPTPVLIGPDRAVGYPLVNLDLQLEELRFARGLIGQWRINRALAHLLFDANARARGDFDRLARRYRAVAADLASGNAVVLDSGDLALAARASMSVPGIFAPVVWNDRILVDGGIVDNLPTDVARALGADRVIAVDVGRPSVEIYDQSPLGIIQRALDLMQENTQRDPIPPDALVLPDLDPGFGSASFPGDPTAVFAVGREAALRDLLPAAASGRPEPRQVPRPPEFFTGMLVEAPDTALAELARRAFDGVIPGPYDPVAVLRAVDRLYTTGLLEGVWPRVVEDSTGGATLILRLDGLPRVSLAAAAGFDNDRGGRAWASLTRYTSARDRPFALSLSASTDGLDRWASGSLQLHPRNRSAFSISLGGHARERDIRSFTEDGILSRDVIRLGGWAAIELPLILRDQVAAAIWTSESVETEAGAAGGSHGPTLRFTRLSPEAIIVGNPFLAEVEHRWGAISYSRAAVRASRVLARGALRLAPLVDIRWTSGSAPPDAMPALGDDHLIPGLQWGEVRAPTRFVGGLDAALPLPGGYGRLRLRSGAAVARPADLPEGEWVSGAQLAFVVRTAIGNMEIGYGRNTLSSGRIDLNIGREF